MKKLSKKKFYFLMYSSLAIVFSSLYFLSSHGWSGYAYGLNDKKEKLVYLGESRSEKDCLRRSKKKLSEGIQISRYDEANVFFCGRYCFENPITTQLTKNQVFCLIKRDA